MSTTTTIPPVVPIVKASPPTAAAKPQPVPTTTPPPQTLDTLAAIEKFIKEPPETSRVMTISPKVAAALLGIGSDGVGRNTHNRHKKPSKIAEYSNDMVDGQWRLTGDTIKFTVSGAIGDGQNRLMACWKARKPFRTHVVFGIADDVFPWLDKGKQRSIGDDFYIDGMENPNLLGRMLRWLELFRLDTVKERTTFSREQLREAYKRYDNELLSAAMEKGLAVQKATNTPRSLASALYYLFASKNRKLADEFFSAWATGTHAGRMAPIQKANTTFAMIKKNNPLVRIHDTMRAAVWVIAWNCAVDNKKGLASEFKWTSLDAFPKVKG